MGSTELLEKIFADAQAKVAAIQEEKERRRAEVEERTKSVIEKLKRKSAELVNERVRQMIERARSQAKLERRKIVLEAKWQLIDRVFSEAKRAILSSPDYPQIVAQLAKSYATPEVSIHLSAEDTKRWNPRVGIKLGEPTPITGGLIVRSGRMTIDLSLDTVLMLIREELSPELAAVLFEGKDKGE